MLHERKLDRARQLAGAFGIMGLLAALLTAIYTFRMVFLAFWGEERIPAGAHPHESPPWMVVPLVLLSIGALGAGYVGVTPKTEKKCHVASSNFATYHWTFI